MKLLTNKIQYNAYAGITLVGAKGEALVEGNKIENNEGYGIKVSLANKSKILRNEIKLNQNGIYVASADPQIISNKIDKN